MRDVKFGSLILPCYEVHPGFELVCALAHPVIFTDDEQVEPSREAAQLVKASMPEEVIFDLGEVQLVRASPAPDPDSLRLLQEFSQNEPGVRVLSSNLSVMAFRDVLPGLVISPITTPETSRLPPAQKRCFRNRWNC